MAVIRIEALRDDETHLFYIAIFNPADAEQPLVTTRARYQTAAAAENDIIAIIAAQANELRPQ
jgi:hypothetical protein